MAAHGADHQHFRMGGGIIALTRTIAVGCDHRALPQDRRADRHFIARTSRPRGGKGGIKPRRTGR
jgi:hypothetical protein